MQGTLPLPALAQIERAALAMLEAVRAAKGFTSTHADSGAEVRISFVDAANEFLFSKERANRSEGYLALLVKHLRSFSKGRESRALASITSAEIEAWLYKNDWSDRTRHGHLLSLRTLFAFCVARSYIALSPALAVDSPTLVPVEKGVHSPEQVRQVLTSCTDPSTLRFLAIRYFGGLRGSEAEKLSEDEIRTESGVIVVSAADAKTRRRRIVTIQPNLKEWLRVSYDRGGRLPLKQTNNRLCDAIKGAGVPWPDNVTRHSFCSYHLAHFHDASRTALEAGHTEEMLFGTYRELLTIDGELITPALAAEFWAIRPL